MTAPSEKLRWHIAFLIDKLPGQCWADLVGWVLGHRGGLPWQPIQPGCHRDLAKLGSCYCGKLQRAGGVLGTDNGGPW